MTLMKSLTQRLALSTLALALGACGDAPQPAAVAPAAPASLSPRPMPANPAADDWLPVDATGLHSLQASRQHGLALLTADGQVRARQPGDLSRLDARQSGEQLFIASLDRRLHQVRLWQYDTRQQTFTASQHWVAGDDRIETLCLYRDAGQNLFLFLLSERGGGSQWLIGTAKALLPRALPVRRLALPPDSTHCTVDDTSGTLFVSEEDFGIWAYDASPEGTASRRLVDTVKPHGQLAGSPAGLAIDRGDLLALVAEPAELRRYRLAQGVWKTAAHYVLSGLAEPETLHLRAQTTLWLQDKQGWHSLPLPAAPTPAAPTAAGLPVVTARVETDALPAGGDAADDPAIWVHPSAPAQSRVLGTDKQRGLEVYDLDGRRVQQLPVGRLNNIDLRPGFLLGKQRIDLAVASNRDRNTLHLFAISPATGRVRSLAELATPLADIYGLCLHRTPAGGIEALVNDKNGRVLQYALDGRDGTPRARLLREFRLASQPEGCVVDDAAQRLFIGEEDVGVWAIDARADQPARPQKILAVGQRLRADVEGLAVYAGRYLIVSSQGDNSYVVLDAHPPFALRGKFRIGLDAQRGLDGVSQTDGLDVTASVLGPAWPQGMLVVQDGRNRLPDAPQNFKYLSWAEVARQLGLP
jgi:3-phytase